MRPSAVTLAEAAVAALALLGAAVTGEIALVAFAAPLALVSAVGLSRRMPRPVVVSGSVAPVLVAAGEPITVELEARAAEAQTALIELELPEHMSSSSSTGFLVRLSSGGRASFSFEVTAERPGRFSLGRVRVTYGPHGRFFIRSAVAGEETVVEVRPARARTAGVPRSHRVRAQAGDRVAPLAGDGIEFADVREESGAVLRRHVNWRATARRGQTCVNVFHPERSTDVVLLVDTFSELALPSVVAAAVNAADAYLSGHDRVGVVCFGGVLDWVEPGTGPMQAERVRRSLLESESYFSYAWKTAEVIPVRLLPSSAVVLALSPLCDSRFTGAVVDLRARGTDIAVIEVSPPPLPRSTRRSDEPVIALADRLIALEHEEYRILLSSWGIPVATLGHGDDLGLALARLAAMRRRARQVGVAARAVGRLR